MEQRFPIGLKSGLTNDRSDSKSHDDAYTSFDLSTARGSLLSPQSLGNDEPDEMVLIYTKIEILAHLDNRPKGYINHTYWIPQDKPLIDLPRAQWDEHQLVASITKPEASDVWVDIVINNVDELGHPFHLVGPPNLRCCTARNLSLSTITDNLS